MVRGGVFSCFFIGLFFSSYFFFGLVSASEQVLCSPDFSSDDSSVPVVFAQLSRGVDVFGAVSLRDGFSERFVTGDRLEVRFAERLDSGNDLVLYASGSGSISVFSSGSSVPLALISVSGDGRYQSFLSGLVGVQDSFELVFSGEVFVDFITDPSAAPGGSIELRAQSVNRQSSEQSQNNFPLASNGSYPAACGSSGDRLSCDDGIVETATSIRTTGGGGYNGFGGVRVSSFNSSIFECSNITQVVLHYEFWGSASQHACTVGVDANGGASWSDTGVTCSGAAPGVSTLDVTAAEAWNCSNFFGPSGTRALAKAQAQKTGGGGTQLWNFDVLYFNVTYTIPLKVEVLSPYPFGINLSSSLVDFNVSLNQVGSLCEYSLDGGVTNYSMSSVDGLVWNATNSSVPDGLYNVNYFCSAGLELGSNASSFSVDTVFPSVSFASPTPVNGFNSSFNSFFVNVSAFDLNEANISFSLFNSSGLFNRSVFLPGRRSLNFSFLPDGLYSYNVSMGDYAGNVNVTPARSINIDTTPPSILFEDPTRPNGTSWAFNWIFVNVSVSDIHFSNITYTLFNDTSVVNISTFDTPVSSINWTELNDNSVSYYYNVSATDTFGNSNATFTRTLTLTPGDIQGPVISIISPSTTGVFFSSSSVFFGVSLDEVGDVCLYSLNGGSNVSLNSSAGFIWNATNTSVPDGLYTVGFYCNDTIGNPSFVTRNFSVDTVFPSVSFVSPTPVNGFNSSFNSFFVNVSAFDLNEANISFSLFNSSGLFNRSVFLPGRRSLNFSFLPDGLYSYNVSVTDFSGNTNSTFTRLLTIDTVAPVFASIVDAPDPSIQGSNVSFSVNLTEMTTRVDEVLVGVLGVNYSALRVTDFVFNLSLNTSAFSFGVYNYTVFANDSSGNSVVDSSGTFRVSGEVAPPVISALNATPDPATFGFIMNLTANVSDDTNVSEVIAQIDGSNYSMPLLFGQTYGLIDQPVTFNPGTVSFRVYANDSFGNSFIANSSFVVVEGLKVTDISVRAANPDPSGRDRPGKFGVILFNPSDSDLNVTNVLVDGSDASTSVFGSVTQGAGSSFPQSGWAISGGEIINWTGNYILPAGQTAGFWITVTPLSVDQVFTVSYSSVVNGTRYFDPHTHTTTKGAGNTVFTTLAFDEGGLYPRYNLSANASGARTYAVSLEESDGRVSIPSNVELEVSFPDGFSSISGVGGTGWGAASVSGQTLRVNTTQAVSGSRITYSFSAVAPSGATGLGLYALRAEMSGADARAILEGSLRVVDVTPPVVNLSYPVDGANVSGLFVGAFNFSVSSESSLANCSLYGNWSGGWSVNQTLVSPPVGSNVFLGVNVSSADSYSWNVICFDTYGNGAFASQNFSFSTYLPPAGVVLSNASLDANDGFGNVSLSWFVDANADSYRVYSSDSLSSSFSFLNETTSTSLVDTSFAGNLRRFYLVESVNPASAANSSQFFGVHTYVLRHNGNTRNWVSFPSNITYMLTANDTLFDVENVTTVTMWNETIQSRVTCNSFSCPSGILCTDTNCNFDLAAGRGYELNVNSSTPSLVSWAVAGIVYPAPTVFLFKNATSFGKNWVGLYANSSLASAIGLFENVSVADAVSRWNNSVQTSEGLIYVPAFGSYVGKNFSLEMEGGYEVSVTSSQAWVQG